jgi:hypothetical protein
MLNVGPILDKLNIRRTNVVFAVTDAGAYVSNSVYPLAGAQKIFNDILGANMIFTDPVFARVATKKLIQLVVDNQCIIDETGKDLLIKASVEYAQAFVDDPKNSYLWAQPSEESAQNTPVLFVEGIDRKVVVNANGGLKKGGKKVMSFELYDKYITKAEVPATRKEFIKILVDNLGLTDQAASTYHYNLKSGQPGWIPQQ